MPEKEEGIAEEKVWARETIEVARRFEVKDKETLAGAKSLIKECVEHLDAVKKLTWDEAVRVQGYLTSSISYLENDIASYEEAQAVAKAKAVVIEKRQKEIADRHEKILAKENGGKKKDK